jgi:hypothetical protein
VPRLVLTAAIALGVSGAALLGFGLYGVLGDAGATGVREAGAVLGIAELIAVGRLVERRQAARLIANSFALLQSLDGVALLASGRAVGVALVPLAGLVVLPLATNSAEHFFEAGPIG